MAADQPPTPTETRPTASDRPRPALARPGARHALIAFGWLNVAVGAVGVVVPGLPTTIFLIIALWAFSRSSQRFHDWLYGHRLFGPPLQAWHIHRVIPLRAKLVAVGVMALSWLIVDLYLAETWLWPTLLGLLLAAVAVYIVTRPSRIPG